MDCDHCGYPLKHGTKSLLKSSGLRSTTLHACPKCGATLDPPIVVSIEEGEGSRDYKKILD